jgi:multiple sugar transport system substrate-binding protein
MEKARRLTMPLRKIVLSFILALSLIGCANTPKKPVTVTLWHTYVEDMQARLDELIRDFNYTVGAEEGIVVEVTSITDAKIINEQLVAAVNEDPGAPSLPDIAHIYPQVAVTLAEKGALVDLRAHFTAEELGEFVPQFIEEGKLGGEALYLLPVTKSVEVLYLNRTLFERFSAETGVGIEKLATFEGIAEASRRYYEWSGGKAFFYPEGLFVQAMIGFQQMGGDFLTGQRLDLLSPLYPRVFNNYYMPGVKGGTAIYDGWSNYLAATGDVVCAVATSAASAFYPARITYPDNTKEDVVFDVLPYPIFEGGEKVAYQRGGSMAMLKSDEERERAAGVFLDWFTQAERNLEFCTAIGYMPVRKAAFDMVMAGDYPEIENPVAEKALLTVTAMQESYRFYFPPVFNGFDSLQAQYTDRLRHAAENGRSEYLRLLGNGPAEAEAVFPRMSDMAMEGFIREAS